MITEKLNIRFIEEEEEHDKGIVYCSSNISRIGLCTFKEIYSCPLGLIEDALEEAGYFNDFTIYDLESLQEMIDDFGLGEVKVRNITYKHFWFDKKEV